MTIVTSSILGHMRSGSSLLGGRFSLAIPMLSVPEKRISLYQTPADLPKLVLKTCELLHKPVLRKTYIVDQINHPYVSDEVLCFDRATSASFYYASRRGLSKA